MPQNPTKRCPACGYLAPAAAYRCRGCDQWFVKPQRPRSGYLWSGLCALAVFAACALYLLGRVTSPTGYVRLIWTSRNEAALIGWAENHTRLWLRHPEVVFPVMEPEYRSGFVVGAHTGGSRGRITTEREPYTLAPEAKGHIYVNPVPSPFAEPHVIAEVWNGSEWQKQEVPVVSEIIPEQQNLF